MEELKSPPAGFPPLRSWEEMQRAHDFFIAVLRDERLSPTISERDRVTALCFIGALCWVLGHDDGVARLIREFEQDMAELGYRWTWEPEEPTVH